MSDMKLTNQHCVPCEGGTKPLTRSEFSVYLPQVTNWEFLESDKKISKEFLFKDFMQAIDFINNVAKIAQSEGHHPDINLHDFKKVTITLWTHAIGGLSINDFVLAVKTDEVYATHH
ncbi:MAG TPA: 4a-hydroxytetrahydrobiopterin dehydratase [Patescibacteria group bacterium]|nr:4a-hydroxytetrahydrobiopterin dehydratase [Patescibacteria group bacterium]